MAFAFLKGWSMPS